jgi:putative hydrolase of the HAD superfamily
LKQRTITIKAVTFDLWNTLLFETDNAGNLRAAIRGKNVTGTLNKLGLLVSLDDVSAALNEVVNTLVQLWDQNKDVTHVDQLSLLVRHASDGKVILREDWIRELSSAYISSVYEIPPYIDPEAHAILQQLRTQNKKIGLICNTGVTPGFALKRILAQQDIAKYFDVMTFSDEVGIRKPEPRISRHTAHELRTKPHETVHVGDNLKADVYGARTAGFKAILLATDQGKDKTAVKDSNSLFGAIKKNYTGRRRSSSTTKQDYSLTKNASNGNKGSGPMKAKDPNRRNPAS